MTDPIHVQPAPEARVAFARWAIAQTPKVPTSGPNTFAVPDELFTDVPEETLIGSTVNGHRYISPDEDQAEPGGEELTGVATADGFLTAVPGEPLPEVPQDAYPADSVPLPPPDQPPADEPTQEPAETPVEEPVDGEVTCDVCGRPFKSERGLQTHMRRAHEE